MSWDTVTPYNRGFREFSAAFESFGFEDLHRGALAFIPARHRVALDFRRLRLRQETQMAEWIGGVS